MTIEILVTGGTIDKEYNEADGTVHFTGSHIAEILATGRSTVKTNIRKVMLKDSLFMTDSDRRTIAKACQATKNDRIVITHGTDTMVRTAQCLAKRIKDKTIVLTGAMIPYKIGNSDALFNLGSALAFAQTLQPGIYIAMNGQFFTWNRVEKNRKLGRFEARRKTP